MAELAALAWPAERLGEALEALAQAARLAPRRGAGLAPPAADDCSDGDRLAGWVAGAVAVLGLEAVEAQLRYGDVDGFLPTCGPALVRLGPHDGGFLAVVGRVGRRLVVVAPDLAGPHVAVAAVAAALREPMRTRAAAGVGQLLASASVPERRRERACAAFLAERLDARPVSTCWLLRLPPGADFVRQARRARLPLSLATFVAASLVQYLLWVASWWLIGRGALGGRLDPGWLWAWGLMLLTLVPVRLLAGWSQASFAIGLGGLLKLRLMQGAVKLDPGETRHLGVGQLLGRVIECETVEAMALNGGFLAVLAVLELIISGLVLGAGAGGGLQVGLLCGWLALTVAVSLRAVDRWRRWTDARLDMTHEMVEGMVGHRTRLAQQPPELWHEREDRALAHYLGRTHALDRATWGLSVLVPRGWLALGLLGLGPALVSGQAAPAGVAVALGGLLLAEGAFGRLVNGLWYLSGAAIAWRNTSLLFHAAARAELPGRPDLVTAAGDGGAVLAADRLSFRYRERGEPVLRDCSLRIRAGDRVLLQGPSGAGKSTLASLLTGLRVPESGLLLLGGLDRHSLGSERWRRRVVVAPQFHENHVFAGSFALNLLMGRRWPPRPADLEEAETVCRELGLGELLGRMPGGLWQIVGETGWQLSHGERSRLFVARALLQGAEVVVFDESFASLDPETLQQALGCVLERAKTVVVIAHP